MRDWKLGIGNINFWVMNKLRLSGIKNNIKYLYGTKTNFSFYN